MAGRDFDSRAAMRRPRMIGGGIVGLGGALLIACLLPDRISSLLEESRVHHRFAIDVPAHIAHALAGAAIAAFLIALASWLMARSLRLACGLPRREMTTFRGAVFTGQLLLGAWVLLRLFNADMSEYSLRADNRAVLDICLTGFVGSLLFAYDVPRLLANARRAIQARKRFELPLATLDALPQSGLTHTEGVSADAVDFAQRGSFMLQRRGAAAVVEIDPDRVSLIIDTEDENRKTAASLPAGTAMRVVAEVKRDNAADAIYRGAPPLLVAPMDPSAGPLRIYVGEAAALRRLALAAIVEIIGAMGLSLSVVWFVGAVAYVEIALGRH